MNTDKELLELAAKAAGIELKRMTQLGNGVKPDEDFISNWHPLTDDGEALRLAVKLGLCFGPNYDNDRAVCDNGLDGQIHIVEMFQNDKYAATRRAIVRAAAEIGKTL